MKKWIFVCCLICLFTPFRAQAQKIILHFPHFAGHQYDWKIFQGEKEVSVQSGKISKDGAVTCTMPDLYRDYRGMTRWLLKSGGGLDMIYTGRGFSVECLSDKPGPENIIYTGNPENDFLTGRHRRQQTILDKLGAVNHLLQVYPAKEALHQTALKEQESLRLQFEQTQADRSKSPLYAARFAEIVDLTRGIADKVYENRSDHIRYFNDYVTQTLNFDDLYTSGHWAQVLHNWLMMNIRSQDGDTAFQKRLDSALARMTQDKILGAFGQTAIPFLVQKGKDEVLPVIAEHMNLRPDSMAALSNTTRQMLSSFKILAGKKAPDLIFKAPVSTQTGKKSADVIIETDNLGADYTILLFYKGSCHLCEDSLITLANRYKSLARQHVRVIAVSGDDNPQAFEKKLKYHQWPDNFCDFTGMDGVNFNNYAVMGIPTLYLLDKKGIILKKSAMADEIIELIH